MLNYGLFAAAVTLGVYVRSWSKDAALVAIVIYLAAERIASAIERRINHV